MDADLLPMWKDCYANLLTVWKAPGPVRTLQLSTLQLPRWVIMKDSEPVRLEFLPNPGWRLMEVSLLWKSEEWRVKLLIEPTSIEILCITLYCNSHIFYKGLHLISLGACVSVICILHLDQDTSLFPISSLLQIQQNIGCRKISDTFIFRMFFWSFSCSSKNGFH